jgi:predicted deacetylase
MSAQYIFRMDDITPTMDWDRFWSLISLFVKHNVPPLLGIVPDNRDPKLDLRAPHPYFWETMRQLQDDRAVEFAQHGYQHVLAPRPGAALLGPQLGIKEVSEFAGDRYDKQLEKIRSGQKILHDNGINTSYWMAPNHSFDETTLQALVTAGFTAVTDGISLYPFHYSGLIFIPQQTWQPRWMPCGVQTICIHSNHVTPSEIKKLRLFLRRPFNFPRFSEVVTQISRNGIQELADASFKLAYQSAMRLKRRRSKAPQRAELHLETIPPHGQVPPQPSHLGS